MHTPFNPHVQTVKQLAQIRNFERGRLKAAHLLFSAYVPGTALDHLYETSLYLLDTLWHGAKEMKEDLDE
jgi:hypothetical protein